MVNENSAVELRAAIARSRVPAYVVAARARINPVMLSYLLNERIPLRPDQAERIASAIRDCEADREVEERRKAA